MFRNLSDESIPVEHRCVIVDVLRDDPDLSVAGQGRLDEVRLVMGKDVEVPDWTAARLVAVHGSREVRLARVLVNDESPVVSKLTR